MTQFQQRQRQRQHQQRRRFVRPAACLLVTVGCLAHPSSTAAFIPGGGTALSSSTFSSRAPVESPRIAAAAGSPRQSYSMLSYASCRSLLSRSAPSRRALHQLRMAAREGAEPLKIGLFGGGTVGGGLYEICETQKKAAWEELGCHAEIAKICVRDVDKPRDFEVKAHTSFTSNYDDILEDDSINCVVELMGGVTDAKDVVFKAIAKGKHVVTANKALLAQYLPEIEKLLGENPGVRFGYEAAVCGGIPIIHTLQNDYVGDKIKKVRGIMNGTTNFMLSKMEGEGADYNEVLKEAQDLGFAEADPTADVEGLDVQAKIALLAKLAYGVDVPVDEVPCEGISKITAVDFEYAKMMGSTIKLLGNAILSQDEQKLSVFVSPVVVPMEDPIAATRGPGNIVSITSHNLDVSSYSGPGAGRFPTANSVASDTFRVATNQAPKPFPFTSKLQLEPNYRSSFYTRITCKDELGIIKRVGELAEKNDVSILAIHQNPIVDRSSVDFVVTTDPCRLSQIASFCDHVAAEKWALNRPLCLSML